MSEQKKAEPAVTMQDIVALCKNRGFIYPGSEIYGGLANSWDYGPLGVELKNNIKRAWWKKFVQECPHNVGLDSAIIMNPKTWEASGHLSTFTDPLMDCKACKARHRVDKVIEEYAKEHKLAVVVEKLTKKEMEQFVQDNKIPCPTCGKSNWTPQREFNLMFKTFMGVTEDGASTVYLRPETAQGIFVNFKNIVRSTRAKMPLGVGQIGKSFRNEITPGNFVFRTREFEQMELEFFCKPGTDLEWFNYWKDFCKNWLFNLGIKKENLRFRDHGKEELSFYSRATTDVEFLFPFGWGELWGIADRTDYDLKQHQKTSGENLEFLDPVTNEKYIPYVIEPSLGADRMLLAVLCNAYELQQLDKDDSRVVLHLSPVLAPVKAAVLPLSKKLEPDAEKIYLELKKHFNCQYDDAGSIGKRYRRQDEIGTPYCVTVDFDTLTDNMVTVRQRDSMKQERVKIAELKKYLEEKLSY